jgi:hypothetical protein
LLGSDSALDNPLHYPLDQLLLMFALAPRRGLVIHAAGVAHCGIGVFCAGRSGAGKTTFMGLRHPSSRLHGLSDDRVVVREISGEFRVFGTPWPGEGRVASTQSASLGAVVFLHHGEHTELRRIDSKAALPQLLETTSILWFDPKRMAAGVGCCQNLVDTLPCYELVFRPEPAAFELIESLLLDLDAAS